MAARNGEDRKGAIEPGQCPWEIGEEQFRNGEVRAADGDAGDVTGFLHHCQ